nr:uncharacterized protein LOC111509459 [Leptinotarsa decemlineata]
MEPKSMTPCMLTDLLNFIKDPPSQNWSEIQVKGNVSLLDNENVLYRILENSVKMNTKNVIFSPVSFAGNVRAENVNTQKNINNLNLTDILEDAVLTESESLQTITGQKWFSSIQAKTVTVLQNADIRIVNGEDIQELNDAIVDKNKIDQTIIRGKKTFFSGLQTNRIRTKKISNLDPDNIVQDGSTKKVPSALFDTLDVENDLNITFFNNINFKDALENRLLVKGVDNQTAKGILFFEYLEAENLFTPKINQIKTKNIVFDEPGQTISGQKRFKKKLEVFGNIITDSINGMQISEEYKKSVLLGESVFLNGSVRVLRPSQLVGNVDTGSINGHLISEIKEILDRSNIKTEVQEIYDLKDRVIEQVLRNIDVVQALPREYMYLEKSDELQISLQNTVSASTAVSKGYVLFHVTGYESGGSCGLPEFCQCPHESTIEISPEHSVTLFPNKGFQRSFSYDDESMTVYFTTNSVSTSPNCSTKTSKVLNEVSTLTWNTKSTSNSDGLFYQYDTFITGHITKVEFFTLGNTTYVIVGRYFDPILENYNLDCTVIKFNENRPHVGETASHVKDSTNFVGKARNITLEPSNILLSFDIVSLFTNVPLNDSLREIANLLPSDIVELFKCLPHGKLLPMERRFLWAIRRRSDWKSSQPGDSQHLHGAI